MVPVLAVLGPWRLKSTLLEFKEAYQGEKEFQFYSIIFLHAFTLAICEIPYALMTVFLILSIYGAVKLYAAVGLI